MKREQELQVIVQQAKEPNATDQDERSSVSSSQTKVSHSNTNKRWDRIAAYTFFVISGQSVATILGRLYYDNGGNSKWLATVVQLESNSTEVTRGEYVKGFVCTVGASAGYGLVLSLQQLAFHRILKKQTFTEVMDMIIYGSLVASCVTLVGLFASSEWKTLRSEMKNYKLGKISYIMNLVWTAVT